MLARFISRVSQRRAASRTQRLCLREEQPRRKRKPFRFVDQPRQTTLRYFGVAAAVAVLPAALFAQDAGPDTTIFLSSTNFFISILAGLILAVAFQLVLTNLSLAAGLNMIGPFDKRGKKGDKVVQNPEAEESTVGETARKISSGFGLWALITASIALFSATWLAVELSFPPDILTGAVLGLVIWGLFYLTMMFVEASAFSSLVGALMRLAMGGLKTTYRMVSGVFSKSDEKRWEETAARVTGAIRDELIEDPDAVKKQIRKYVQELKPRELDANKIRDEVIKLLDDTEIRTISRPNSQFDEETVLHFERASAIDKEQMKTISRGVRGAFSKIREEAKSDKDNVSKVIDAALRVAGISSTEAAQYRQRVEDYLRSTGREELDPDSLKRDLETFFRDPKHGKEAIGDRLAKLDRSSVTALLAQQEDMSPEQAERYVNKVYGVIDRVKNKRTGDGGESGGQREELTEVDSVQKRVKNKLRNYFDSLQVERMSYDYVADDFYRMFHGDLRGGASNLVDRLKSLSRDDIKSMVAARSDMTEEDADRLVSRIENARDSVVNRYNQTISQVKQKAQAAKDETLHQMEEARKTAATAAWWVLASAVVSGIAAVLGGILATGDGLNM